MGGCRVLAGLHRAIDDANNGLYGAAAGPVGRVQEQLGRRAAWGGPRAPAGPPRAIDDANNGLSGGAPGALGRVQEKCGGAAA